MAPLLDGLLDPELDLRLMFLSLKDRRTHATLTNLSIVRPSVPSSSCTSPHFLWVPLLRIPWATSLCQLVQQHLNLRLVSHHHQHTTVTNSLTIDDSTSVQSQQLLHVLNHHGWRPALELLYPPLPHSLLVHNRKILDALRKRHKHPRPLERLAIYARIAYANSLLSSLKDIAADLRLRCGANLSDLPDDDKYDEEDEDYDVHSYRHRYSQVNNYTESRLKTKESSHLHSNDSFSQFIQGRHQCRSTKSRFRNSRSRIIITAHPLPPCPLSSSSPRTTSYMSCNVLVHGVIIRGDHLNCVREIVLARYGIEIAYCLTSSTLTESAHRKLSNRAVSPTLSSLSNRGTALLFPPPPTPSFSSPSYSLSSSDPSKLKTDSELDEYLRDSFGTTWMYVVSNAVLVAEQKLSEKTKRRAIIAQRSVTQLMEYHSCLVHRALALDVAGAKLVRISAFAVVQSGLEDKVTDLYGKTLDEARGRVNALSRRDCRHAAKLVASAAD